MRVTQSLRIWPSDENAAKTFEEEFRVLPTLDVGVVDLPRPVAPWVHSRAAARVSPLIYLPLLFDDSEDSQIGKPRSQLAANLELSDLGQRIEVTLRRGIIWSDGSRQVSAIDLVRALSDRAQPRSPSYNARWADLLERIETIDPERVAIRLRRTPLEPISLLVLPIGPAHAAWDGSVSTESGRLPVGDGPYRFVSNTEQVLSLLAAGRSPNTSSTESAGVGPRIARIHEVRLPDANSAIGALERGEVALLEHLPADRVVSISKQPEFAVGRYRLSANHLLAVDGRTPILQNRNFRRALSYALNRTRILEENVLKGPVGDYDKPLDGPFAADSSANAANLAPLEFNVLLARMLVVGTRRELSLPQIRLTLEYPALPEAQAAVPRIAESLRNIGLLIDLVERPEAELEERLRIGQRFDLAYRVTRCDQPLREVGGILCPGYDAPPQYDGLGALASPRILQLLLQLEHAADWDSARQILLTIDRECRDELPIIPLWQLREHFAYRKHLKGPPEVVDTLYQGIESWEIEPWFANDPW